MAKSTPENKSHQPGAPARQQCPRFRGGRATGTERQLAPAGPVGCQGAGQALLSSAGHPQSLASAISERGVCSHFIIISNINTALPMNTATPRSMHFHWYNPCWTWFSCLSSRGAIEAVQAPYLDKSSLTQPPPMTHA